MCLWPFFLSVIPSIPLMQVLCKRLILIPLYAGYKSIVSSANNSFTYTANTNSVVVLAEISDVNAAASTYSSGAITYAGSVASAGSVVPSASTLLLTAFSNGKGSPALSFSGATPVGNSILVQGNASGSFNPASLVLTDYFGSGATITPGITASASSPSGTNTYAFLQLVSAGANANATLTANLLVAQVGTTTQSVGTLNAGANISFSGTAPNLTIAASTTASANITIEQAGTSIGTVGTINFPAISVAGGVATVNLSDQLDAEFSSTQGAVLYRDASAWQALGPGTAGQVLQRAGRGKSVLGCAERRRWRSISACARSYFRRSQSMSQADLDSSVYTTGCGRTEYVYGSAKVHALHDAAWFSR